MVILALACINHQIHAEISSINTMEGVHTKIEGLLKTHKPEDILVAFDIDMTLIQPEHAALYYPTIQKYLEIYQSILEPLTPVQRDLVATLITQIIPQRLVEKNSSSVIKSIQHQDVKVIAFTSSLAGKIEGFSDKTIFMKRDQLQKMGFDFTNTFKNLARVVTFFDFKKFAGARPIFYHGVLSTNGEGTVSKGELLISLLQHVGPYYEGKLQKPGYYPKIIVFVDNDKKHLENIEEELKAYDPSLQFMGIVYRKAFTYGPKDILETAFQKFWKKLASRAKKIKIFY